MIHPDTELRYIGPQIGHGLVATRPIPRGTVTWAIDPLDRRLDPGELALLPAAMGFEPERHLFVGRDGRLILPWDLARFVNHSCSPTCLATDQGYEIAVRDIEPGEELTNDYANLGMHEGETFRCACGAPDCRREVHSADRARLDPAWRSQIAAALVLAPGVAQPLIGLLPTYQRQQLLPRAPPRPADNIGAFAG